MKVRCGGLESNQRPQGGKPCKLPLLHPAVSHGLTLSDAPCEGVGCRALCGATLLRRGDEVQSLKLNT